MIAFFLFVYAMSNLSILQPRLPPTGSTHTTSYQEQRPPLNLKPPSLNLKPPPPHNSRHESTETTTPATDIDDAGVDITPLEISSTRNKIAQNLRENRANMTKSSRKRSAKAVRGLSRPRDATIVNEVNATKGKPTPERAANLLAFMEDDED